MGVGIRKISRRVYSVRITIGGISDIVNVDSISEWRMDVGLVSGSVVCFHSRRLIRF